MTQTHDDSARDKDKIGTKCGLIPKMKEKSGTFSMGGRLYIYQKVSDWRFYVVSSVPMMELYKSSIRTIFLMAFILLFLLTISLLVSSASSAKSTALWTRWCGRWMMWLQVP